MLRKASWKFIIAVLATALMASEKPVVGQTGSPAPKTGNSPGGTNPGAASPGGGNAGSNPGSNPTGTNPGAIPGTSPASNNPGGTSPGNTTPGNNKPGATPANPAGTNPGGFNPATTSPGGPNPGGFNPATTFPGGASPGMTGTNPNLQKNGANTPPPTMQGSPPTMQGSPPTMQGGATLGQNAWFGNPNVQQQLNLGNNQFAQLNQAYGTSFNAYQQAMAGLDPSLSPAQRSQRMQELQQNFYKNYSDSMSKIITDPQMRARYEQLHLQYRGVGAFNDPIIQNKLFLTDAQRQQFSTYNSEWLNNMGELHRAYQTDPQGAAKRFDHLYRQDLERMYKALTPQQRQLWNQMRGEAYDFQPNVGPTYSYLAGQ